MASSRHILSKLPLTSKYGSCPSKGALNIRKYGKNIGKKLIVIKKKKKKMLTDPAKIKDL